MILNAKLDGRRKVGRARLRWMDDVQADLRKIGITNWRKKATDRGEWMVIKRDAKNKLKDRHANNDDDDDDDDDDTWWAI